MESQSNDFSYFLTGERDLESLAEDYFSARPVDEQDDQEDNYGSDFYSSDESDQEIDSDVDFHFSERDTSERSKVQAFVTKTCGRAHGYKGSPCCSTIQVEDIVDCRNNCAELSSTELDLVILGMIHSAINCDQVIAIQEEQRKRGSKPGCLSISTATESAWKLFFSCIVSTRPDSTVPVASLVKGSSQNVYHVQS